MPQREWVGNQLKYDIWGKKKKSKKRREAGMDESLVEKLTTEKPHRKETVRAESPVNPA